jgi:hypothetical protein
VPPGDYVLQICQVALVEDSVGKRLRTTLEVIDGPYQGKRFDDYLRIGSRPLRILRGSAAYNIIAVTYGADDARKHMFDPEEDLVGYRFRATVERGRGHVRSSVVPSSIQPPPVYMAHRAEPPEPLEKARDMRELTREFSLIRGGLA